LVPAGEDSTSGDVSWNLEVKSVPGFVEEIMKGQISKATEDALRMLEKEAESVALAHGGRGAS